MIKLEDILEEIVNDNGRSKQLDESSILNSLFSLLALGAVHFIGRPIIDLTFNAIGNTAKRLKDIFSPSDILKLDKMLAKDKEFSKDILRLLSPDGEYAKHKSYSGITDALLELPSFKRLFDKFCEDNKIKDSDKDYFYRQVKGELSRNLVLSAPDIVKDVKRKHKELKDVQI